MACSPVASASAWEQHPQNNPKNVLLIDSQRPFRLVVHAFLSCRMEIVRF